MERRETNAVKISPELKEGLERAAEKALAGVYVIRDGVFIYANPKLAEIFGYDVEELIGMDPLKLVHEEDRDYVAKNLEVRIRGQLESTHQEFRGVRKNGEIIYVESYGSRLEYKGKPIIVGTLIDITRRKKLEIELKKSERKYKDLFNLLPDLALIIDQRGNILEANAAAETILGYAREELLKMNVQMCLLEEYIPRVAPLIKEVMEKGKITHEVMAKRKDGKKLIFECSSRAIEYEGEKCVLCIGRDVTERREMLEKLRRYHRFYQNAEDMFFILDRRGRFLDVNPKFAELLGYTQEEILGNNSKAIILPEDLESIKEFFKKVVAGKSLRGEFRFVTKDGRVLWFEIVEWPVKENSEIEVEGIVRDITEKKLLEENLRKSEEKYRIIVENSQDGIVTISPDLRITYASPSAGKISGYDPNELVGQSIFENLHPDDLPKIKNLVSEAVKDKKVVKFVHRYRRKDGRWIYLDSIGAPVFVGNRITGAVVVSRDVTEIVRLTRFLEAMNRISKAIVHGREETELLRNVAVELAKLENFKGVVVWRLKNNTLYPAAAGGEYNKKLSELEKMVDLCSVVKRVLEGEFVHSRAAEVCKTCKFRDHDVVIGIPMITGIEKKGVLIIYLSADVEIPEKEMELLKTVGEDIAYALRSLEIDELRRKAYAQIQKNIEDLAIAIDRIRNPLAIISGIAEMMIDNREISEKIMYEISRIESFLESLDKGWVESEEVRKLLRIL